MDETKTPNNSHRSNAGVKSAFQLKKGKKKRKKGETFWQNNLDWWKVEERNFCPSVAHLFPFWRSQRCSHFGATASSGRRRRAAIRAAIIESRDCKAMQFVEGDDVWDYFPFQTDDCIFVISEDERCLVGSCRSSASCFSPFSRLHCVCRDESSAASWDDWAGLMAPLMAQYSRGLLSLAVPGEVSSHLLVSPAAKPDTRPNCSPPPGAMDGVPTKAGMRNVLRQPRVQSWEKVIAHKSKWTQTNGNCSMGQ